MGSIDGIETIMDQLMEIGFGFGSLMVRFGDAVALQPNPGHYLTRFADKMHSSTLSKQDQEIIMRCAREAVKESQRL